jgi:hypothetical protein
MILSFKCRLHQGNGFAVNIVTSKFRFGFGIGKSKAKPVFYYRFDGYDKVLKTPTILRHINILRFGHYCIGFSLSIPYSPPPKRGKP